MRKTSDDRGWQLAMIRQDPREIERGSERGCSGADTRVQPRL